VTEENILNKEFSELRNTFYYEILQQQASQKVQNPLVYMKSQRSKYKTVHSSHETVSLKVQIPERGEGGESCRNSRKEVVGSRQKFQFRQLSFLH
jgi:hypothetical protein